MNDRFKFRVWDKFVNKYIDCAGRRLSDFYDYPISFTLEQCTGLKDKNGKLIYEGDIVRHDTAAGPKVFPVEFKHGGFTIPYPEGSAFLGKVIELCPYKSGVDIVGNIHENPGLLGENYESKNK